jgi:hypothetical protein
MATLSALVLAAALSGCLPSATPSAPALQPAADPARPSLAPSQTALEPTLPSSETQLPPNDFPLAGTWTGTARTEEHEIQVRIVVQASCAVAEICGTFVLSLPCAGTLTLVGHEGGIYEFRAADKTGLCSQDGRDFLQLLPDGRLGYDSRGDYGQAIGSLSSVDFRTLPDLP